MTPGINALRRETVVATLQVAEAPMSLSEISQATGIPKWALSQTAGALLMLEAEGKITRTGRARGTKWRIA